MSENSGLPEWTAQALVALGAVFLLVSAYVMGVMVPNGLLAPNDFDVKNTYIDSENYNENNWEINVVKTSLTLRLLSATAGNLEYDPVRLGRTENLLSGLLTNSNVTSFSYYELNTSQNLSELYMQYFV